MAGKDALLEVNVFFTSEVLAVTGWTTGQQTALETSVEKEFMLENPTASTLIRHSVQNSIQQANLVQLFRCTFINWKIS